MPTGDASKSTSPGCEVRADDLYTRGFVVRNIIIDVHFLGHKNWGSEFFRHRVEWIGCSERPAGGTVRIVKGIEIISTDPSSDCKE
jgi:hypothetical protein